MARFSNVEVLVEAFGALSAQGLWNLKHHLEVGTPIFCGEGSDDEYRDWDKV